MVSRLLLQAMPLRRADARQELIDTERFRDIVIGAKIERCDLRASLSRFDKMMIGKVSPHPDCLMTSRPSIRAVQGRGRRESAVCCGPCRERCAHRQRGDDIALALQARMQKAKDCGSSSTTRNTKRTRAWHHNKASGCGMSKQSTCSFMRRRDDAAQTLFLRKGFLDSKIEFQYINPRLHRDPKAARRGVCSTRAQSFRCTARALATRCT